MFKAAKNTQRNVIKLRTEGIEQEVVVFTPQSRFFPLVMFLADEVNRLAHRKKHLPIFGNRIVGQILTRSRVMMLNTPHSFNCQPFQNNRTALISSNICRSCYLKANAFFSGSQYFIFFRPGANHI